MWASCCHDTLTALPYGELLRRPKPTKQQPQEARKCQGDSLAQHRHHWCAGWQSQGPPYTRAIVMATACGASDAGLTPALYVTDRLLLHLLACSLKE